MSYLRTNYRATGGQLDALAFGPAMHLGSQGGGSGVYQPFGGLIQASLIVTMQDSQGSATAGATGYAWISTVSLLASVWGCDSPLLNSGIKVWPANIHIIGVSTGDGSYVGRFGDRVIIFRDIANSGSLLQLRFYQVSTVVVNATQSAPWMSIAPQLCSDGVAVRILFTGFVTSGPGAGW